MKLAQSQVQPFGIRQPPYGIGHGVKGDNLLTVIVTNAITIIFTIGAVLLIFFLLWGAIDWIMSAGDKEKAGNARKKITSALIGLVIMALTYVIVRLLGGIFGFNVLQPLNIPMLNAH